MTTPACSPILYRSALLVAIAFGCASLNAATLFAIPESDWQSVGGNGFNEVHGNGMVGYCFTLTQTVTVTNVGWYDSGADGLSRDFQVGLWQKPAGGWQANVSIPELLTGSGLTINGGSATPLLDGHWRVASCSMQLTPGEYQIAGLDSATTTDTIRYLGESASGNTYTNNNAYLGEFFYAYEGIPSTFGVTRSNFYAAAGMELGPMLFIVPEPSAVALLMIGGSLVLVRRARQIL